MRGVFHPLVFFFLMPVLGPVSGFPPPAAMAESTPVRVELEPLEITVGDPIEAELILVWDGEAPTATPRFPDWPTGTWGNAEVLAVGEARAVSDLGGRYIYSLSLTLNAFEAGHVELPSLVVIVPHAGGNTRVPTGGGVRFEVKSVLPAIEDIEPRPGAPLRALPGDRRFLWTAGTLTALCLLAAGDLRRRLSLAVVAMTTEQASVPLEPLEELVASLKKIDTEICEPAHTALSLALRRFLGRSLGFNALESTTHEIGQHLARKLLLTEDLAVSATRLLAECDQVKYAHLQVAPAAVADRLESAEGWARRVELELRPPKV